MLVLRISCLQTVCNVGLHTEWTKRATVV